MSDEVKREAIELGRQLLAFGQAPGRHALALGEPRELFEGLDTLAQWALGRLPESLAAVLGEPPEALVGAAVLFIQRACFAPGSTHYQVLGFTPQSFTPELLRPRYRALIRLTHPDMGISGLPADAAGMVNRAQDVLVDVAARQRYDQQLQPFVAAPMPNPPTGWPEAAGAQRGGSLRRRPAAALRLDEPRGLADSWLGLIAQYPRQWRALLLVVAVAAPISAGLFWLAQDSTGGQAIVVARRDASRAEPRTLPAEASSQPERPAASPHVEPPRTVLAAAQQSEATRAALARSPQRTGDASAPAAKPSAEPHRGQTAAVTQEDSPSAAGSPALPAPVQAKAPETTAHQPRPHAVPATPPFPLGEAMAPEGPAPTAVTAVATAPSDRVSIGDKAALPTRVHAKAPEATVPQPRPRAAPTLPVSPSPRSQALTALDAPAAPVWSVDEPAAKRYLADIVASMESAAGARHLQSYLVGMNVQGSLLRPVAPLLERQPELKVQRSAWSEDRRLGGLSVRSLVVLQPRSLQEPAQTYRLLAEFRGTESGTMLVRLDLGPE